MPTYSHQSAKFRAYCDYIEVNLFDTLEKRDSLKARFIEVELYATNLYIKLAKNRNSVLTQENNKLYKDCLSRRNADICKSLAITFAKNDFETFSLYAIFNEWYDINRFDIIDSHIEKDIYYIILPIIHMTSISDIPSSILEKVYDIAYRDTPLVLASLNRTKHRIMNAIMKHKTNPNKSWKDILPIIAYTIWNNKIVLLGGISALVGFAGAALLNFGVGIHIFRRFYKYVTRPNSVEVKTQEKLNAIDSVLAENHRASLSEIAYANKIS